jgi:hypothetical protein
MGKKGNWFSAVKKVFSSSDPDGREAKVCQNLSASSINRYTCHKNSPCFNIYLLITMKIEKADKSRSRRKWPFGKSKKSDPWTSTVAVPTSTAPPPQPPPPPPTHPIQPQPEEIKDVKAVETDSEQNKHAYSVALASAVAAEAAAVAAQAAAEVVRLTTATTAVPKSPVSSKDELAAIKIQTAFRGYLVTNCTCSIIVFVLVTHVYVFSLRIHPKNDYILLFVRVTVLGIYFSFLSMHFS